MMLNRTSLTVLLLAAVAIWGTVLFVTGIQISWDHAKPFTITVTILTAGLAAFNKTAWAWRIFSWFHHRPDLRGTWQVELVSTYRDKVSGAPVTMHGYAAIRQTYSALSIRLMTKESTSGLIADKLMIHDDETVEIAGVYQSDPEVHLRGRVSEIHYGAFKVTVVSRPPTCIQGHYWTDRHTNGTIIYTSRVSTIADSYAEAEKLYPVDTAGRRV